jgi:2-methylisocitrate lyase-like PEP mutase family enzyme
LRYFEGMTSSQQAFAQLHASGCFVMPNPWDVGSARLLASLGFKALASSSAGFAFSRGLPDKVTALHVEDVLAHLRELVAATALPVNADFQSGYGRDAYGVEANVAKCIASGVAGLSIEDATGNAAMPLYDLAEALERLKAARKAIRDSGREVVLTARCEAWLVGVKDPLRTALDRLVAYSEAGADCLFAPGVRDPKEIRALVKAVAPKPLHVIVSSSDTGLNVSQLADLGVRRISVGSALARVALGAFMRSAQTLAEKGVFALEGAAPFAQLNEVFSQH